MHIADANAIPYLYTELSSENPLRRIYQGMGFVAAGNGLFRCNR